MPRNLGQRLSIPILAALFVIFALLIVGGALLASGDDQWRENTISVLTGNAAVIAVLIVVIAAAAAVSTDTLLTRNRRALGQLASDTQLIVTANPDHRIDDELPAPYAPIVRRINELADLRTAAVRDTGQQIATAQADLERERSLLATLLAELVVAVVACNSDGRVLLYNASAQRLFDDESFGLGRSLFEVLDRDMFDHADDWIAAHEHESSFAATTVVHERLLHVRIAAINEPAAQSGYLIVVDDHTDRVKLSQRRDEMVRQLTESTRAALGSIQAAIETVIEYPDLGPNDQAQFFGIVHEESQRLGKRLNEWAQDVSIDPGSGWARTSMSAADVLALTARALQRSTTINVQSEPTPDGTWVSIDSHALSRALSHLATRIAGAVSELDLSLRADYVDGRFALIASWSGNPRADEFHGWLDEPLAAGSGLSVRDVVSQHGGEIWIRSADTTQLTALLGVIEAAPQLGSKFPDEPAVSRPEFYDFELFERQEIAPEWADRRLESLSFTVFDTETTGLYPDNGDQVISIGAVRIVNGRVLVGESFDQLIDPRRPIGTESTRIHGITNEMVAGQPDISSVLPRFKKFADDTVLVGHNVGFDLQFFRRYEKSTGVVFDQPVLDTLLLDAALHTDHESHSLEAIAKRLGVSIEGRHTAHGDALATAQVFSRLLKVLNDNGLQTLGQAQAAANATLQARKSEQLYRAN